MKLRIEGNSIRMRLRKSEIELFEKNKTVNDALNLGNSIFVYSIEMSKKNEITSQLSSQELKVFIPELLAEKWINSSLVSLENKFQDCNILIEKDFKCTSISCEESQKNQSDFFENPKQNASR